MNPGRSLTVAIKDMKEVFSSISIYGPMLAVPTFFAFMLPALTFYVALYAAPSIASRIIPYGSLPNAPSPSTGVVFMTFFSISVLGPIFLTMPVITASVIAADSFAGEKERKTSEALLATPISISELLVGKILASFLPTMALTLIVFGVYTLVTNYFSMNAFQVAVLPNLQWYMMLLTAPFLAIATIGTVVLISSHVRGVKESQQLTTLIALPVLTIPFLSIFGVANLSFNFFLYLIILLALVDFVVIIIGIKTFKKEAIL